MGSEAHNFPFEMLLDQFHRFGKFAIMVGTLLLPILHADVDSLPDFNEIAETADLGPCKEELEQCASDEAKKEFNKKVVDIFSDMANLGYI